MEKKKKKKKKTKKKQTSQSYRTLAKAGRDKGKAELNRAKNRVFSKPTPTYAKLLDI